MAEEKMKYADRVLEAKKKWKNLSEKEKEIRDAGFKKGAERFLLTWDFARAIEKKCNIDAKSVLKEQIWEKSFAAGQRMATKYKEHGIKDLYDAYNFQFEGLVQAEWFELNDEVLHKWNHECPVIQHFRDLGITAEELSEMADYYCLQDIGFMTGFNPKLEVFHQSRLLMKGDSHCTYRVEDHGGK
jgi:hypothetical protein